MCSAPKTPPPPKLPPAPPPPPTPADTSVVAQVNALRLQRRAGALQRQRATGATFATRPSILNRAAQLTSRSSKGPRKPKVVKKSFLERTVGRDTLDDGD